MRKTFFLNCILTILIVAMPLSGAQNSSQNTKEGKSSEEEKKTEQIEVIDKVEEIGGTSSWQSANYPVLERGINILTPRTLRRNSLLLVIDHRSRQRLNKNAFHDFLGFDAGGLKIGLGLRYGLFDCLETGLYRLNGTAEVFDVYEFDLKYRVLKEENHFIDLALRCGLTWFSQPGMKDASGFFTQILGSKTCLGRVSLTTGLLYHSDSSNDLKSAADTDYSLAIPALIEVRLCGKLAWDLEMAANVAGYGSKWPAISSGLKIITNRHTFSLVFSNTQYISADGIAANSGRGFKDTIIGFTITREFDL